MQASKIPKEVRILGFWRQTVFLKDNFQHVTTNGIGTFDPRLRTFNRGEVVVIEFR